MGAESLSARVVPTPGPRSTLPSIRDRPFDVERWQPATNRRATVDHLALELTDRDNDAVTLHVDTSGVWIICTNADGEIP